MEPNQLNQVEQQVRQNWSQVKHHILDQFPQVSAADLTAATSVTDIVQRIADKSGYSDRFVEGRLRNLVGVSGTNQQASNQQSNQGQPFGAQTNASPQIQPQYAESGAYG